MKDKLLFLVCLLFCGSMAYAQIVDDDRMFSFERAAKQEMSFLHDATGRLSVSDAHFKNGSHSLCWDYQGQGVLSLKKKLRFEAKDATGRDNYLSAFIVWVYNEKPQADSIVFRFLKDGRTCCSFPMYVNFKGWRGVWVCYERDMQGHPVEGMNEMRIQAPSIKGRIFFDHLITAVKVDARQQTPDCQVPFVNKKNTNHWLQVYNNSMLKPDIALTPLTAQERQEMKAIEGRYRDLIFAPGKLYNKVKQELHSDFAKYDIKEKGGNVMGKGIWFVRHAEAYERMVTPWDKELLTRTGFEMGAYFTLMKKIAIAYNKADNDDDREDMADMFLKMYDHITDQGVAYGSCWGNIHHYGYSLRDMYPAYFLMKDVLRKAGKLAEAERTMIWYAQTNEVYIRPVINGMDMDTFNTAASGCMASILLMEDSPEKVQYLRSMARWLDWGARPAQGLMDSFKSDGSAYHHCNNYPAYAVGGLNGVTQMIYMLSGTSFAVGQLAHETVKKALLAMRFYCNRNHFPLSMSGRHPDGMGHLTPVHYALMAFSGTPDKKSTIDPEMGAAFIRLMPEPKSALERKFFSRLQGMGIKAEIDPEGNMALGYACVGVQRRQNWAAVVRGHSRYLWAAEHYVGENLYGRYMAHGCLQILTAPLGQTVTPLTSGWQEPGFDWNRIPGTTTIHLPYEDLKAKIRNIDISAGVEEMLLSDESFAGGLSQVGQNGNFAMKLHEHDKYNGSLHARKSWHAVDGLIVCLGSNICDTVKTHPTETTVFQLTVDGSEAHNFWDAAPREGHVWMDPAGTGYYTPGNPVFDKAYPQHSVDQGTGQPTQADWVSLTYNHGMAPHDAGYEYAVMPQTTKEDMQAFAAQPTYEVLQCDSMAHVVRFKGQNTVSYVLFETPRTLLPGSILAKADTSCLVMVKQFSRTQVLLTVAQPDLALYRGKSDDAYDRQGRRKELSVYGRKWRDDPSLDIPVSITLLGSWAVNTPGVCTEVSRDKKTTVLRFLCSEGKSYDVALQARKD
ncbi:chondroitinase family polysaccharide lyase [Hallella seregens]|uniref:Chondroitinase family polysaccharide lyase n=1 Tax=Hallella seregens ATCC 51272 TaxID=1336250 RepID=A0ABV5ZLZ0_9BACT|nr:chondroitinase family polysaccharide lyase [Hallella seregens]